MSLLSYLSQIFKVKDPTEEHQAIIDTLDESLLNVYEDIESLPIDMNLDTSTGDWLDKWGKWITRRRDYESDDDYRDRIIKAVTTPKNTIPALADTVCSGINWILSDELYTVDDINIKEPFNYVKSFSSIGGFSGEHRFPDSTYWRPSVIDIEIPENLLDELISIVDLIRSGGVKTYYTIVKKRLDQTMDISSGITDHTQAAIDLLKNSAIFFAPKFDSEPPIAYKQVQHKYLVVQDDLNYDLVHQDMKWRIISSSEAQSLGSSYVYMDCSFVGDEMPLTDYNTVDIYTNLVKAGGVAPGKAVLLPSEVSNPGSKKAFVYMSTTTRRIDQKEFVAIVLKL